MTICDEKIWIWNGKKWVDAPPRLRTFYKELDTLCRKYNFSISHQDYHGAFIIEDYNEENMIALQEAEVFANIKEIDFDEVNTNKILF